MQPHCANFDESSRRSKENPEPTKLATIQKQTIVSAKSTSSKDNGRSQSKATSTVFMKQTPTRKQNTIPNSAERLSYYDR